MNTFKTARPLARLRAGRNDWYAITAKAGVGEVLIYDEIGYFGITAQDFARELSALDVDRIDLRLNTPGGDVFDGIAIYNALRNHAAKVAVSVDGLAASIGSVIAMAGDEIVMARNASMMIHEGHGMAIGNAADMAKMADLLDKTSANIASIYAERSGRPAAGFREQMRAETWFDAQEAVDAGLADRVAGDGATADAHWDLSIFARAPGLAPAVAASAHTPETPPAAGELTPQPGARFDPDVFRRAVARAARKEGT